MSKSQKPSAPSDTEVAKTLEGTLMFVGDSVSTATSRIHEFHRAIRALGFNALADKEDIDTPPVRGSGTRPMVTRRERD